MVRSEVFLIQKGSYKECKKNDYKANTRQCKYIEELIICTTKLSIYIPESDHMYQNFGSRSYPEDSPMYAIEYN